jgi:hypothetical protein
MNRFKNLRSLHIEASGLCQAYCVMCPRHGNHNSLMHNSNPNISLSEFNEKIVPMLNEEVRVFFCGNFGDPMMNSDIAEIAIVAKKYSKSVMINTNGGVGKPSDYYKMAMAGIELLFDFEGTTQEINERYRRGVYFSKLKDNINAASAGYKDANFNLLTMHVLPWKHTVDDIENIYKFANDVRASIKLVRPNGIDQETLFSISDRARSSVIDHVEVYDDFVNYDYNFYYHDSCDLIIDNSRPLKDVLCIADNKEIKQQDKKPTPLLSKGILRSEEYMLSSNKSDYNYYSSEKKVSCHSLNFGELFITHDMILLPCCWLGLSVSGFLDTGYTSDDEHYTAAAVRSFLKLDGKNKFSLRLNSLDEVLESNEFNNFAYNYIKGKKILKYCENICGISNK